jgi:hypothetical protein
LAERFGFGVEDVVTAYRTAKGLVANDPIVTGTTMSALDADSTYELFDGKSAELHGTRFELGARTGTRIEFESGIATCAFQNGIRVEVGHFVAFAMPTTVFNAWSGCGAEPESFGLPSSDPTDIDGRRAAQEFEFITYLFGSMPNYSLPRLAWEASLA